MDGPDGCGKSTQCQRLAEYLQGKGIEVVLGRDPGDTAIGEQIRHILLNPEHGEMDTRTELLLYMAARAQVWTEKIAPALAKGQTVILDRWLSSTCAYQGYAGGFGMEKIVKIATDSLERVWPDLTIILDVDLDTAATRLKSVLDRMEQKGRDYHARVREGFLKLADSQDNMAIVDAAGDIERIHQKVIELVEQNRGRLPIYQSWRKEKR